MASELPMPETPPPALNTPLPSATIGLPETLPRDSEHEEESLKRELARLTPPNDVLLAWVDKSPPPAEWLDDEEELPF